MILTVVLTALAAATIAGLVLSWPHGDRAAHVTSVEFAAPGVTFPVGTVTQVHPACADDATGPDSSTTDPGAAAAAGGDPGNACGSLDVALGAVTVSVPAPPSLADSGLAAGDRVQLMKVPTAGGGPDAYSFMQVQRSTPLVLLLVLFVVVVAAVARWKGILGLVGLAFGGFVIVAYMLPALLEGQSGLQVALVGASAIMFVVLYLAHGFSIRTSTAMAGTLLGVGITALLGVIAVHAARLSGLADDESATLSSFVHGLSTRELFTCAIIIAGLGVLNDVTITQSSAVWELRAAAPGLSRREVFAAGMRIGRDHIASTIYTIVFAYAGAALPVLMLIYLYDRPMVDLLQTESLAEEIVRTLASGIGLVLAVPATTAIAALAVAPRADPAPRAGAARAGEESDGQRPAPRTRAEARALQATDLS
ncbi:MAG: YibE/F family protein [Intrasporangium sp.]|uniref:YibE/F family protein n=1 Tax=Intrasporangium sp. TaxID=1925024 RepID=UPI003F8232B5